MELAAHQSPTKLLSDGSKSQLCGELMTRKILRSAKIKKMYNGCGTQVVENNNNNNNNNNLIQFVFIYVQI
jgi:hypothetical protein